MRLIDADALEEKISDYMDTAHIQSVTRKSPRARTLWSGIRGGVNYCRNLVFEAHTIEAEPVKWIPVAKARYGCDGWHGQGGRWTSVTHWMPLPEPPKMDGKENNNVD